MTQPPRAPRTPYDALAIALTRTGRLIVPLDKATIGVNDGKAEVIAAMRADGYEIAAILAIEEAAQPAPGLDVPLMKQAIRGGVEQWVAALDEDDSEAQLWHFIAAEYARLRGGDGGPDASE